jgi:hypothetical protein
VTYALSHVPALSTGPNTNAVAFTTGFATVTFGAPTVTVPAGKTAKVSVTITANAGLPDKSLYGGYIVFTPQGEGQVYRVPYAGIKGDYQSIQVLTPTVYGFPWLASLEGGSYFKAEAGEVFTLAGDDLVYFLVHMEHQARQFRIEIYEAGTNRFWRRAYKEDFLPRNSTSTSFFAFAWDGMTFSGDPLVGNTIKVPDGNYYATLHVLKALGDERNPAHWETWTSPVFTIDRP